MAGPSDLDVARALWAEDCKVNEHGCELSDMDPGTQALFLAYAKRAREMLTDQAVPPIRDAETWDSA